VVDLVGGLEEPHCEEVGIEVGRRRRAEKEDGLV